MHKQTAQSSHSSDAQGNRFRLEPWSCPICKKSQERVLGPRGGKYHRYGLGIVSQIAQCKSCGLLYPNPFPIPLDPQALYGDPEKYFVQHDEASKVERCRELAQKIATRLGKPTYSLLDVGSGRGELLRGAQLEGHHAVGLEFSQAMIDHCRTRYGIETLALPIERLAEDPSRRFDAIIFNAVLEHVYDPDAMIAAAAKLCDSGAILYIDVPNEPNLLTHFGNWLNRLSFNPSVYNLSPSWSPYHVYGFNPKSMKRLLAKHGFRVLETQLFAYPHIPSKPQLKDRIKSFAASQIIRAGNLTGMAGNMLTWAVKL